MLNADFDNGRAPDALLVGVEIVKCLVLWLYHCGIKCRLGLRKSWTLFGKSNTIVVKPLFRREQFHMWVFGVRLEICCAGAFLQVGA